MEKEKSVYMTVLKDYERLEVDGPCDIRLKRRKGNMKVFVIAEKSTIIKKVVERDSTEAAKQ